ncbi:MAG TPA: hypothetical protein VN622_04415 [Clostridia bacterium]|nr:hypothetical protein [Clostridia bacterium]
MARPLGLLRWFSRNGFTAVLIVALIFMSLITIEQGRTITNQRALIRQLFSDSLELSANKLRDAAAARQQHPAP